MKKLPKKIERLIVRTAEVAGWLNRVDQKVIDAYFNDTDALETLRSRTVEQEVLVSLDEVSLDEPGT
jgi:hypothetical protein